MQKITVLTLLLMFLMPGVLPQGYASDEAVQTGIVDVGNKICPVMGGPVNGKDFVVYEGKRYGLCCPGCKKAFLADPASYIARVNTAKTADETASSEMQKDMEQGNF